MKSSLKNLLICGVACAALTTFTTQAVQADSATYNKTLKATAWVLAKKGDSTVSGSGVLVDAEKKLLLTNQHLVRDERTVVVFFPARKSDKLIADRSHYLDNIRKLGIRGRVLGFDRKRDLALIELDKLPEGVEAMTLAADSPSPGASVQSISNTPDDGAMWMFTAGTVRSVYEKQFQSEEIKRSFNAVEIQTSLALGDTGGPLVNDKGELVALMQSVSGNAAVAKLAVDISDIKVFLQSDWKSTPKPIADVLKLAKLDFKKNDRDALEVEITLKDKKTQKVFVSNDLDTYEQADLRKIWSLAATLKESPSVETTLKLLEQSARTKIGVWSIEKSDDDEYLVIFVCKVDATMSPAAVKSTMEYTALVTELAKKDLTSKTTVEDPADVLNTWLSEYK